MMTIKEYKELVKIASLAGQIMLESNAESYRVETTVEKILATSQLPTVEVFANTTGLFITLDGPTFQEPMSYIKRVTKRETHLSKIHTVNQISRDLTAGKITLETAYQQLKAIRKTTYSQRSSYLATILLVVSFAVLLGGDGMTFLVAILASLLLVLTYYIRSFVFLNDFIFGIFTTTVVAGILSIFAAIVGARSQSLDIAIISVLMPLFPGTAFTNGFRDSFKGDYGAGVAKIVEALTIAASLGVGVALGLFIAKGVFLLWQ